MMKPSRSTAILLFASLAGLVGCDFSKASSTKLVTARVGGTRSAGIATLTIPADALTKDTEITLREAEPEAGRVARIEVQPHDGLRAGREVYLSFSVDSSNPRVIVYDANDNALQNVEVSDRNRHVFKTNMGRLFDIEVEVELGATCMAACSSTQECDDGICKTHYAAAFTCATVCPRGEECDDGVCRTHNDVESRHGGAPGTCSPTCSAGLQCEDGLCSPDR
jgi:hypothetical protein